MEAIHGQVGDGRAAAVTTTAASASGEQSLAQRSDEILRERGLAGPWSSGDADEDPLARGARGKQGLHPVHELVEVRCG